MPDASARAPYQPREGSRVWGYLLPLLLGFPLVTLAVAAFTPSGLVGGVITAGAIGLVYVLSRRR